MKEIFVTVNGARLWEEPRCYDFGFNSGTVDSSFSRTGTGTHKKGFEDVGQISDLVTQNIKNSAVTPEMRSEQSAMFTDLMKNANTALPGNTQLTTVANQSPTGFQGANTLNNIIARNPFTSVFEDATKDEFKQRSADAMAQIASGPEAVRGGDARTSIAQGVASSRLAQDRGQEVRSAQQQEAASVLNAIGQGNQAESTRTEQSMQAAQGLNTSRLAQQEMGLKAGEAIDSNALANMQLLQLAAQLQGKQVDTQADNFSGRGDQSQSTVSGGCCFIFLQGLNGQLPWFIEIARHEHYTDQRKRGYKWMSKWLVPKMQRSETWTKVVNAFIIKPFLTYGAWLYKDEKASKCGMLFAPWCKGWLHLWNVIGKFVK